MERARPSAALNSSTLPYASTRGAAFESRRPYINDVSPLSPVLVTMDTRQTEVLERWSYGVMRFVVAHHSINPSLNRSQVAVRLLPSQARQRPRLFPPA